MVKMTRSLMIAVVVGMMGNGYALAANKTYEDGLRDGEAGLIEMLRYRYVQNKHIQMIYKYKWSDEHNRELEFIIDRIKINAVIDAFNAIRPYSYYEQVGSTVPFKGHKSPHKFE